MLGPIIYLINSAHGFVFFRFSLCFLLFYLFDFAHFYFIRYILHDDELCAWWGPLYSHNIYILHTQPQTQQTISQIQQIHVKLVCTHILYRIHSLISLFVRLVFNLIFLFFFTVNFREKEMKRVLVSWSQYRIANQREEKIYY